MPRSQASRSVRPNHETRWPNRYIFASVQSGVWKGNRHDTNAERFTCAVVQHQTRQDRDAAFTVRATAEVDTCDAMWQHITDWKRTKTRTVLVAHNVGRLLQVSDAFRQLTQLGWRFDNGMIDYGRAWVTWTHGRSTLVMTDIASWCSHNPRRLASMVGHDMRPIDTTEAAGPHQLQRAHAEVDVIADAWHRMRSWCEDTDCGMWRPTGAGQSFAAYRHKFLQRGIVHHGDDALYERERLAVFTGRCEAYARGVQPFDHVDEWDMHLAYARVGRDHLLPTRVLGTPSSKTFTGRQVARMPGCTLADVTITTDTPCVPTKVDGRIVWPVGTFTTTLWNPEIALAVRCGAEVECTNVVRYLGTPMLKQWAHWIIELLDDEHGEPDPVVHAMLKSWARTVVGRFGLRYASWEAIGALDPPQFGGWSGGEIGSHERRRLMALGTQMFQEGPYEESPDSAPAVMGYIMAQCRAQLFDTMRAVGEGHVLYVDTDGMLLDPIGSQRMARRRDDAWRRKHRYQRVEILGPRQLIVGREVKAAGVPFRARVTHGHRWEGEAESSPFGSLRSGTPGQLTVRQLHGSLRSQGSQRRLRLR